MNGTQITITAAMNPSLAKLIGTWEVYNSTETAVYLCRIKAGKRSAIAAANLLSLSPKQFNEISA